MIVCIVIHISYTPDDVYEFILLQLQYHDYVSTPQVYDVDEEYVATLLYSLASLQTRAMAAYIDPEKSFIFVIVIYSPELSQPADNQSEYQILRCREIIANYMTYPSPSFKCKVLIAALYAESVFEMCARYPVTTLFSKYIDVNYPVYAVCSVVHD